MNRFEIFALVAVLLVAFLLGNETAFAWEFYTDYLQLSRTEQASLAAAWMLATFGPLAIALLFWRVSKRVRWPWLLHLLFLPCAWFVLRTGSSIMLDLIQQPDFDSMMGIPIMPATLLMLVAFPGYAVAVGVRLASSVGAGRSRLSAEP